MKLQQRIFWNITKLWLEENISTLVKTWRRGLEKWLSDKHSGSFFREPTFTSQQPQGSSRLSVTPVQRGQISSSDLGGHQE